MQKEQPLQQQQQQQQLQHQLQQHQQEMHHQMMSPDMSSVLSTTATGGSDGGDPNSDHEMMEYGDMIAQLGNNGGSNGNSASNSRLGIPLMTINGPPQQLSSFLNGGNGLSGGIGQWFSPPISPVIFNSKDFESNINKVGLLPSLVSSSKSPFSQRLLSPMNVSSLTMGDTMQSDRPYLSPIKELLDIAQQQQQNGYNNGMSGMTSVEAMTAMSSMTTSGSVGGNSVALNKKRKHSNKELNGMVDLHQQMEHQHQ
jgi:hypothetical protein